MRYFALMLAAGSMLGTWIETSASTVSPQPPPFLLKANLHGL